MASEINAAKGQYNGFKAVQWLQISREKNRSKYEIETVTKHK